MSWATVVCQNSFPRLAELVRVGRVSRARITQIMDLLLLAPEIQEEVLGTGDADRRG